MAPTANPGSPVPQEISWRMDPPVVAANTPLLLEPPTCRFPCSCRRQCGSDQGDDKIRDHPDTHYLVGFLSIHVPTPRNLTYWGSWLSLSAYDPADFVVWRGRSFCGLLTTSGARAGVQARGETSSARSRRLSSILRIIQTSPNSTSAEKAMEGESHR